MLKTTTFLNNNAGKSRQICVNNTATNRLATALAVTTLAIARGALAEEQTDTSIGDHTLLHRKALLVISAGDSQNVTLKELFNILKNWREKRGIKNGDYTVNLHFTDCVIFRFSTQVRGQNRSYMTYYKLVQCGPKLKKLNKILWL